MPRRPRTGAWVGGVPGRAGDGTLRGCVRLAGSSCQRRERGRWCGWTANCTTWPRAGRTIRWTGRHPDAGTAATGPGSTPPLSRRPATSLPCCAVPARKGCCSTRAGSLIREVNRSYYHADAYRYPLALFTLPDGRTGVVHCPEDYNRLEIDDARTGHRLVGPQVRPHRPPLPHPQNPSCAWTKARRALARYWSIGTAAGFRSDWAATGRC
jgi:hypothetical protein